MVILFPINKKNIIRIRNRIDVPDKSFVVRKRVHMPRIYFKKYLTNERNLSIIVFSLFFSWQLAFPFEGKILYALADVYKLEPHVMVFGAVAATFAGLSLGGFFVKKMKTAKILMLGSIIFCILASVIFFFRPNALWLAALISSSFLTGSCVAAWGFYLKSSTVKNERIKTVAEGLIYSNIIMIFLNITADYISPFVGLGLSIFVLAVTFIFAIRLPENSEIPTTVSQKPQENTVSITKPLAFMCLFIVIITINSGLMYQVQGPAYSHLEWLTTWYWAIPYIIALFVMKNLSRRTNRAYILYVAIAMMGFSFILFLMLDRSWASYLVVNSLMLGACGIYDLFWWSILGEMLDFHNNPAKVLGIGISANVLGVLSGGLIGNVIRSVNAPGQQTTLLALGVVCITLMLLPPLHKHLTALLKDHAYLTVLSEIPTQEQNQLILNLNITEKFTEREGQITTLLIQGKTYRVIAEELHVSENTIKTHVKNIYSKSGVQNRTELMNLILEIQPSSAKSIKY